MRPPPLPTLRRRDWLAALTLAGALRAQATPVVRYGGDAAFAPFESLDSQGRPQGFQIDLLRALEPVMDVRFEIGLQPWEATEAAFRAGQTELLAMVDTPARRGWARFAHGHATPALAVYLRQGDPEPQALQDLTEMRLAVPDREAMQATLDRLFPQRPAGWLTRPEPAHVIAALRSGEADAALLPRAYADPLLAGGQTPDLVASNLVLHLQPYAFAAAPDNAALITRINAALQTLERDGTLEALRKQWLSSHRDKAEQDRLTQGLQRQTWWTWGVAGASALGIAAAGALVWRRGQQVRRERQGRRAAEAALARADALLERSFTFNPEPMLLVERGSSVIRDTNAALQTLLGVPARSLLGQALPDLSLHIDTAAVQVLIHSFDEHGGLDAVPVQLMRADGKPRDCLVSAEPLSIGGVDHAFCLLHDVTDQLAQDSALRESYQMLAVELERLRAEHERAQGARQRAEQSLQEFTRAVSHDLRAPLIAMQGFVGLLRERLRDGHMDEAEAYTEHIERAARRMGAMVAALTDMAGVTRKPLGRVTVDMQELARQTWTLLCAAEPGRHVEFRLDQLPIAHADADLAAQVWQNLLHNAWKYSARTTQARVSVDSFRDARGIWYRVTDNGAGFDMARAGQLFQPFQRLHKATEFEGTGVGLSLVRRIVDHHSGEIRLRSAPGVGTVAEFTLDAPPESVVAVG